MKTTCLLFLLLFISACKKDERPLKETAYFEFDEVQHYYFDIPNETIFEIGNRGFKNKNILSEDDQNILNIIVNYSPELVNDKDFSDALEKLHTFKHKISDSDIEILRTIFKEKKVFDSSMVACDPFYRDILVFRNKNHVTGIAKICYQCGLYHIIGARTNTDSFGEYGDWDKLTKVLYPKGLPKQPH